MQRFRVVWMRANLVTNVLNWFPSHILLFILHFLLCVSTSKLEQSKNLGSDMTQCLKETENGAAY